ncbi:hypothetical protein IV99_04910 [Pectobacterium brasiliense]|nr:hypothetical protein IV99_04910 [Pectobacterium brasiliense]
MGHITLPFYTSFTDDKMVFLPMNLQIWSSKTIRFVRDKEVIIWPYPTAKLLAYFKEFRSQFFDCFHRNMLFLYFNHSPQTHSAQISG